MRRRLLAATIGSAILAAGVFTAPLLLRQVEFFSVRRVELFGVRYLSPEAVLSALHLEPDQNLFDDRRGLERRALSIPGVVEARVERRLPATLRVWITERVPVAFTAGPDGLVALDLDGHRLPYDPAATGLDLPVVERPDTLLVRMLWLLRVADSTLFRDVNVAARGPQGTVILEFGEDRIQARATSTVEQMRAAGAVRRHLAQSGRAYNELDLCYEGWVVVRRRSA